MKSKILCTLLALGVFSAALSQTGGKAPVFVTTSWLADHLNDPNLVLLNVAQSKRDYERGHILGARFLWVGSMAVPTYDLSFELPPVENLDTLLAGLGISNNSRIILCGVNNVSATARMYVTLEYLGMEGQTSILDGGFEAWKAENRSVTKEWPQYKRAFFHPYLKRSAIVNAEFVKQKVHKEGVTIVDARAPQFYEGKGGGYVRGGHIPGARNLFFATLVDTANKYLPPDSLRAKFAAAGIHQGDELVTYCHVGQTASTVYVAAKALGYNVHLYDGSFEDWSSREDLPVEVQPAGEAMSGGKK